MIGPDMVRGSLPICIFWLLGRRGGNARDAVRRVTRRHRVPERPCYRCLRASIGHANVLALTAVIKSPPRITRNDLLDEIG